MTATELEKLLADIRGARVAVIGDFCLDAYWTVDASRSEISVETGLATRPVSSQRYSLGGAGNVVSNLLAMGVRAVSAFGAVGSDPFGREMLRIAREAGADTTGILVQERGWDTPAYIKPMDGETEQTRIDFGNANSLDRGTGRALLEKLQTALPSLDLVIINQQLLRGIHTEETRRALASLIGASRVPFICDSRSFSDAYDGAIRKLNDREALRICGKQWESEEPVPLTVVARAAEELFGRWKKPVFITRGPRGILVRDQGGAREVPGLQILGRIDTVGAGDSALAGIAAALAVSRNALDAATLGNFAAGVTVRKLFITGTASPEEIMAIGSSPDYVMSPELADDPRGARFHPGSEIEIVSAPPYTADSSVPEKPRILHAIFDNDGTISTLREGWEGIMGPVMVRAILGKGWRSADAGSLHKVQERVRQFIDKTTGVQTLAQMYGLVEMVRELGLVPDAEIKDPFGYKAEYNDELVALVARRLAKLERGELGAEDYMLKGALPLLKALHAAGVKLWLASGSDEPDVVAEAKALGHERLFEGRIHGAVGDVKVEAKKVVIEKILAEIGNHAAGSLVTFGDGPVEMRETKKRGGYAVGVASDELRRFGINEKKRSRLIRAGADIVVPDFSQWRTLLGVLGVRA
jgi:rfaE bifunctional protein kinase chain/domain